MPTPPYVPSADELASLLRARTVNEFGVEVGTFDATTTPTADEADAIIAIAVNMVLLRVGTIPEKNDLQARAKAAVLLLAARLVETTYFPEQAAQDQSAAALYGDMYNDSIGDLAAEIQDNEPGAASGRIRNVPIYGLNGGDATPPRPTFPADIWQRDEDDPIDGPPLYPRSGVVNLAEAGTEP